MSEAGAEGAGLSVSRVASRQSVVTLGPSRVLMSFDCTKIKQYTKRRRARTLSFTNSTMFVDKVVGAGKPPSRKTYVYSKVAMLPESKDKLCVLSLTKQGSTTSQKRIFEFKTQDQSTAFTNFLAEKKDTSVSYGDSRTVSDMNLGVFTWNVGNAEPTDLSLWLPPLGGDHDLIVIGAQECEYKTKNGPGAIKHWPDHIMKQLGEDWVLVDYESMVEVRLFIAVRTEFRDSITAIQNGKEATGLGHMYGNKGGVGVAFNFFRTSMCFITAHLAAHQPEEKRRNDDVAEIFGGLSLGEFADKKIDPTCAFDHIFFCGDLNYRVDVTGDKHAPANGSTLTDATVREHVARQDWAPLIAVDQLNRCKREGLVYEGFSEMDINFAPTFKITKGTGGVAASETPTQWNEKRVPSYCDRVLWKSTPSVTMDRQVQPLAYESAMLLTSDHHPVRATFNVPIVDFVQPPETQGALSLKITTLQAMELRSADLNGFSDPYCVFISPVMTDQCGKVKTSTKPKTLNPEWGDSEVPDISLRYSSLDYISERCITVTVWDSDLLSANDLIGQGRINLAPLIAAKKAGNEEPVPFELKLTFNGAAGAGTLKGLMTLVGSVDAGASTIVERRKERDSTI